MKNIERGLKAAYLERDLDMGKNPSVKIRMYAASACTAVIWAFAYLVFAFITWDFNPGNWNTEVRFICAFISTILTGILVLLVLSA